MRRQLSGLGAERVRDGAVVVLDNATGDVLAYVGGVGLNSTAAAVDGANARRQAGSTLKPHLYAQVIERGWLTAASRSEEHTSDLQSLMRLSYAVLCLKKKLDKKICNSTMPTK